MIGLISKDFLIEEYVVKRKTINQISKEIGKNNKTVSRYLHLYEIEIWSDRINKDYESCTKICPFCEQEFSTVGFYRKNNGKVYPQESKNAIFCSKSCQSYSTKRKYSGQYDKTCQFCFKSFKGGPNKSFCSDDCLMNKDNSENSAKKSLFYVHFKNIIKDANKRKIQVSVSEEYLLKLIEEQNFKCALTGLDIYFGPDKKRTASLDRIDSSIGYIEGNLQWVHKHINISKQYFSQEYYIEMCKNVAKYNKDR